MNHFGQGRHFGVQARTFQVLACLLQAGNDRLGKMFCFLNRDLGVRHYKGDIDMVFPFP
jgi:hypothetical protein